MSKRTIQELLEAYVNRGGANISAEEVSAYLDDPEPVSRRIALELMFNLTGDARYLLKCVPLLKDDPEVLWEFLVDYTSELKDSFVITLLIIEGLKNIDPVKHFDKVESLIFNWHKLNPCFYYLPDDPEVALKVKNLLQVSLPAISSVFVSWILMGVKRKPYFEFDFFHYYLVNLINLKQSFPDYTWETVKSLPHEYNSFYEMGILSVLEYDIVSANEYFIKAAEHFISKSDFYQAYNVMLAWYDKSIKYLMNQPELIASLEEFLWDMVHKIYFVLPDDNKLLIMSTLLYCEIALMLSNTDKFRYNRILELSKLYEKRIETVKDSSGIRFDIKNISKPKIKIGFMAMSISKSPVGSIAYNLIKRLNPDKFDIYFYDCGMMPAVSKQNRDDFVNYAKIRSPKELYESDKIQGIEALAKQINLDNIDILVYEDWLYNVIGHAVCSLNPAPIVISMGATGITTGLSSVPIMLDYLGIASRSKLIYTEDLVAMPIGYPYVDVDKIYLDKQKHSIPEDVIWLYSFHDFEKLQNQQFLDTVFRILNNNKNTHFAFAGNGDKEPIMNFFKEKNLIRRVSCLGNVLDEFHNAANIKMSDVYLNPFPESIGSEVYYAMLASTPVVTMKGQEDGLFASQIGAAIAGIDECIAQSVDEYVDIASKFIRSEKLRSLIAEKLRNRALREFDINKAIKKHEELFIKLYESLFR